MADINSIVLPDGTEYPISDYYLPVDISNPASGQVLKYDAENQVWYNGEDASGSSVLYGTSAPTSQLGTDGCLYVKYTEGTGGASDTVDALYVKLDGAWCQISTGGGGGASSADQVSVDDTNLEYEADDVQEALEKIYKRMTLAEYEQLSHAEKYNGTIYLITDVKGANQRLTKQISNKAIASFETDLAENLINLEVAITATGGGGTPVSPIAINGFSACNLMACGKNLFGGTYGTNYRLFIPKNTRFTISAEITGLSNLRFAVYDKNEQLIDYWAVLLTESGRNYRTFNLDYDVYYVKIYYAESATNLQIAFGTDITYQAYNGTTKTISFGQTVYGGRLNVGSGVLTVTHKYLEFDYQSNWLWENLGSGNAYVACGSDVKPRQWATNTARCNCATFSPVDGARNGYCYISVDKNFNFTLMGEIGVTNLNDFKTYLQTNNLIIQVVAELATPIEIQLDSIQIQAIIGTNNVYSDTGDIIDLKFVLSVGKAIS